MKKLLNKPWFVGLLALAAVVFVGQSLLRQKGPAFAAAPATPDAAPPSGDGDESPNTDPHPTTLRAALLALKLPEKITNPFAVRAATPAHVPGDGEKAEPDIVETVHISAVWSQGKESLVLINDHIYRVGDTIGRLSLDSAGIDGVWLSHWKGRDFVPVGSDFTLVTPARQAAISTQNHHEG